MNLEAYAKLEYERLARLAIEMSGDEDIKAGKGSGIYGAFSKHSGECIYIGKSKTSMARRWREHRRYWKKDKPIHRQPLLAKYMYFFKDQVEWRVLFPIPSDISNDMLEYIERRMFEKYEPIANAIIPNGTIFGRSILEGEGEEILISEWNPNMVQIRIKKGEFNGFSDDKDHFKKPASIQHEI